MKIDQLSIHREEKLARATARVTWEDCDRPQREIFFDTEARFIDDLSCNPDAFLLASILPAMRHGERRIQVEGPICPRLRNGLMTVMQHFRNWYGPEQHRPIQIEPTGGFVPPHPSLPERTASFMSGGVDSLATLRRNRLDFPLDHPGSIRVCFFIHGFDIGGIENLDHNRDNFDVIRKSLSELAMQANLTLIPVYTNLRYLDDDTNFFTLEDHGAALAAVAHSFSKIVTRALIPSSSSVPILTPFGSHPLIDPNYSSAGVGLLHDGLHLSRREKVELIAQWKLALGHLRSCNETFQSAAVLNCAKCHKCILTMTHLLLCGRLSQCPTYPLDQVTPELLQTIQSVPPPSLFGASGDRREILRYAYTCLSFSNVGYWKETLEPLRQIDRHDLVRVIEQKLGEFGRLRDRVEGKDWRGKLRRLDQKYLKGILTKLSQVARGQSEIA